MSENLSNFANDFDDDPVGGLAYTDFSKPMPVLEGEDAERFVRMMEENEILDYELREIENLKKDIEKLEKLHAKAKEE